ncbi:MAG: 4-oxalocrotonate tautomerase [Rhodanobacter lindaniclasticus]
MKWVKSWHVYQVARGAHDGRRLDPGLLSENTMPTLHLEMLPGRTVEQKRAFVREVTRATAETLACPPESVDILISEVPRDGWAKAGKLMADA